MSLDALTLVSRIIERTAQKCGHLVPTGGLALSDEQRSELLVETLASQLLGLLGLNGGGADAAGPQASDLERICDDQIARNQNLARALGACDCWGELPACDHCSGRGVPGWRRPDPERFDLFVRPVIQKMKRHHARVDAARGVRADRMPF